MSIQYWQGAEYKPRKWQEEALIEIVRMLREGNNPIVSAIMGSGKSVLIAELIYVAMQKLKEGRKIIVTAPRQHLVAQLHETIANRVGEANVGMFYTHRKEYKKPIIVTCNASAFSLCNILTGTDVSLLVGDEVHGTEADNFKEAFKIINPACAVGFTATPYRSNDKERLTLFQDVAYRYTASDALRDNVIVPWRLIHWDGKDADADDVDKICVDMIREYCRGPGIISALDINDAERFSAYLQAFNIRASAIHSKQSDSHRKKLLEQLKNGELHVLVHVNLLSEGVNLPYLRWICLRRPVQARVRFVQEVGRVLRSYPGKDYATFLDPHDLFSMHGIQNEEMIGDPQIIEVDPDVEELATLLKDTELAKQLVKMPPAVAKGHLDSWVARLLMNLTTHGVCKISKFEPTPVVTKGQVVHVHKMRWASKFMPGNVRGDFKSLLEPLRVINMKPETVSNIITILHGLANASSEKRKQKRYWKMPSHIVLPSMPDDLPMQGLLFLADKVDNPI